MKITLALLVLALISPVALANGIDNFTFNQYWTWSLPSTEPVLGSFVSGGDTYYAVGPVNNIPTNVGGLATYYIYFETPLVGSGTELYMSFMGFSTEPSTPAPPSYFSWSDYFYSWEYFEYGDFPGQFIFSLDGSGDLVFNPGTYTDLTIVDPPTTTPEPSSFWMMMSGIFAFLYRNIHPKRRALKGWSLKWYGISNLLSNKGGK